MRCRTGRVAKTAGAFALPQFLLVAIRLPPFLAFVLRDLPLAQLAAAGHSLLLVFVYRVDVGEFARQLFFFEHGLFFPLIE
jgi:hypothetical protein